MKNNSFRVLRNLAIGILFGFILFWIMDYGFNGSIKEWFYEKFLIEPFKPNEGKLGVLYLTWSEIKTFFVYSLGGLFLLTMLILLTLISIQGKAQRKNEKARMIGILDAITGDKEMIPLPNGYSEIETKMIRIRDDIERQRQLAETEMQRKSDLITYLAHDLKTPLASVIGYCSLLDEANDMPEQQKRKYVRIALEKAYRLEELINEFFEITRFNLHTIVISTEKIRLSYMLEQMADEFYPIVAPMNKKITLDVSEQLVLSGDSDKLARVFNNILKNAVSYSDANTAIAVAAEKTDDEIHITFTNKGNPIPSHKLKTIFEKFYRLDTSRSTRTGGSGLGLAIAKEIVTAHGGDIEVQSSEEKTVFTVKLPS